MNKKLLGLVSLTALVSCGGKDAADKNTKDVLVLEDASKTSSMSSLTNSMKSINDQITLFSASEVDGKIHGVTKATADEIVTELKAALAELKLVEADLINGKTHTAETHNRHKKARAHLTKAKKNAPANNKVELKKASSHSKDSETAQITGATKKVKA